MSQLQAAVVACCRQRLCAPLSRLPARDQLAFSRELTRARALLLLLMMMNRRTLSNVCLSAWESRASDRRRQLVMSFLRCTTDKQRVHLTPCSFVARSLARPTAELRFLGARGALCAAQAHGSRKKPRRRRNKPEPRAPVTHLRGHRQRVRRALNANFVAP